METIEPLLAEHPMFKGLDPQYLKLMTGCASNVRWNQGEFISHDGDQADAFFLIRAGSVALDVFSPTKGEITFLTLREGELLGWSWLVPPYRVHGDVRAIQLTRAIKIDAKCLREKCAKDPQLELELYRRFVPIIVDRIEAMTMQLLDVYSD
jgi:CRP/FNR family transcriptional regulator, cyclic AMP receptor protein